MPHFSKEVTIDADVATVWAVLADIGNISVWNPGVVSSNVTTDQAQGVGAGRHCDLEGKNYLDEEVVEWVDNDKLTIRIIGSSMPFKSADIHFRLIKQDNGTKVTVAPEYELKYGVIGTVLDKVFVNRVYQKGMQQLLDGLKQHIETTNT